jgi:acyl-CoA thioesterase
VFRTRVAKEGFAEVDGELWSEDGTLLAQSRQLSLCLLLGK